MFIKELPAPEEEHHYQPFSLLFIKELPVINHSHYCSFKELPVPEEVHHYQPFSLLFLIALCEINVCLVVLSVLQKYLVSGKKQPKTT